jgi:hypothetical protein
MTSYPETLTVKKLIKMEFFIPKIYYISRPMKLREIVVLLYNMLWCGMVWYTVLYVMLILLCYAMLKYGRV